MTLSPEDYQRATELYHEIFDLSKDERTRILREHAPSPEILAEVEFLLQTASDDEGAFEEDKLGVLGQRLLHQATAEAAPDTEIGPYRIVRKIGEGGMGVVYAASREGADELTALKVLRPLLDSAEIMTRFRREAALLKKLQHPGIARFFEAGEATVPTQTGDTTTMAFLAMEFVDGDPIDLYANRYRLTPNERLELMVHVCEAVDHAHACGVVHRDLKPANILVIRNEDRTAQPKILDFGIARTAASDMQTLTLTEQGALLGTVPYMSPEQVSGGSATVDARSDVYSLGVLLFELLANRLPYDVRGRPIPDAARIICDEDPTSLAMVDSELRGNVDTIVAKCLEKQPDRRYANAGELAADLRRHLQGERIVARPPTLWFRTRRFARRHRLLVAVLVTLFAGLVGTTWFAVRAGWNEEQAQRTAYFARIAAAVSALETGGVAAAGSQLDRAPAHLRKWEWRLLHARLDQSLGGASLQFENAIEKYNWSRLSFSPDGQHVRVFWKDIGFMECRGFDTRTNRWDENRRVGEGRDVSQSVDGEHIYVLGENGQIRVHSCATGKVVTEFEIDPAPEWIEGRADGLMLAGSKGSLVRIAPGESPPQTSLKGPHFPRWMFAGASLTRLAGADARGLHVIDLKDTTRAWVVPNPIIDTKDLILDPAGRMVVALAAHDARLGLWQIDEHGRPTELAPLVMPRGNVTGAAFSPDGKRLACAAADNLVRVWDVATREKIELAGHVDRPILVAFSPDGERLASMSELGNLRIWPSRGDPRTIPHLPRATPGYVYDTAYGSSGDRFYTGSWGPGVRIFDSETSLEVACIPSPKDTYIRSIAVNPDETMLAISESHVGRGLRVIDLRDGKTLHESRRDHFDTLSFSRDGSELAGASPSEGLVIWSTTDWKTVLQRGDILYGGLDNRIALHTECGKLLVSSPLGELRVLDAKTHRELGRIPTSDGRASSNIDALTEGPRAGQVTTADNYGRIRIWNLHEQKLIREFRGTVASAWSMAYAQDDRLFTGAGDGVVRVWDTSTGSEIARFSDHRDYVIAMANSPDRSRIITASGDATLRVWDTTSLRERTDRQREYRAITANLQTRVAALCGRLGTKQAIEALRSDASLSQREREIAAQLCLGRVLPPTTK